jgi:TctA family transporter
MIPNRVYRIGRFTFAVAMPHWGALRGIVLAIILSAPFWWLAYYVAKAIFRW